MPKTRFMSKTISAKEWGKVTVLATLITKSNESSICVKYGQKLFNVLDRLEKKYGENPNIIATRAEYIQILSNDQSILLYKRAYDLSKKTNDFMNCALISESLCTIYIEDFEDPKNGAKWINRFETHLKKCPDRWMNQRLTRLITRLNKVMKKANII